MDRGAGGRDGRSRTQISNHAQYTNIAAYRQADLPALSNLYMRRLVLWWKQSGTRQRLRAVIVNYADDLVICCKGTAEIAMQTMREVIKKLQLEVNEDKFPKSHVYGRKLRLPGLYVRTVLLPQNREGPSQLEAIEEEHQANLRRDPGRDRAAHDDAISRETGEETQLQTHRMGELLPPRTGLQGLSVVDAHTNHRLRQWLCSKHRVQSQGFKRFPNQYLYETLKLVRLPGLTRNLHGEGMSACPRAGCAKRAVRFDEGVWKQGYG